nr:MAG TPA: hypothetical protein [Caudoviricetes sp.]
MKTINYYRLGHNYDESVSFANKDLLIKHLKEFLKETPNLTEDIFELALGFCPFNEENLETVNNILVNNLEDLDIDELRILFGNYYNLTEEELILEN